MAISSTLPPSTTRTTAASTKWVSNLPSIAARVYFFLIILQVPLFQGPLQIWHVFNTNSCHIFPIDCKNMTVRTWDNLLTIYNLTSVKEAPAVTDLQRLEVLAGSYFSVAGALVGILKPGRMSMFGTLLVIWGLVKEGILGKPANTDPAKAVYYVYPTVLLALICAYL